MSGGIRSGWLIKVGGPLGIALLALLFTGAPEAYAAKAEYCVKCKGPKETYRCRLKGSGVTETDAFKLYCVVRTTKEGNHASCAARKDASCQGIVKVYKYDGPILPSNVPSPTESPLSEIDKRASSRENDIFKDERNEDQPKSLFELGGRAYDASKKGLSNAGQGISNAGAAIGLGGQASQPPPAPEQTQQAPEQKKNFARRSWDCMTSLFRECGEQ